MTDRQIERRLESGLLVPVQQTVYRHPAVPFTIRTRLLAAILACGPPAVASHRSAAMLHGFDIRRARPEVTVVGSAVPLIGDVTIHRTKLLQPIDVTTVDGIPCTSAARTGLELGAVLRWELFEHVLQVACIERRLDLADLVAVFERLGCSGKPGTAKLRAFLRDSVPDARLATLLEHLVHEIVRATGFEPPELQHPLVCADGREVVLDMAWPRAKLAIEPAGHRWHATRKQLDDDERRRRSIKASGWDHNVFTWSDAWETPTETRVTIEALLAGALST